MSRSTKRELLKDLPSYSWEHERVCWQETRLSKAIRLRKDPIHELLGTLCPEGTERVLRWRNLLKPKEVPWLHGHKLQGQTVFPAAGYVALALEATKCSAKEREIQMIEIQDLIIDHPLVFEDNNSGVETLVTLSIMEGYELNDRNGFLASFEFCSAPSKDSASLVLLASSRVQVKFGGGLQTMLPPRSTPLSDVVDVDTDQFYFCLAKLGYEYSGPFRGLSSMRRTMDAGTGFVSSAPTGSSDVMLMVHPAMLDSAFQSVFLAFCWPGDGRLWSLHFPTQIHRIRVVPSLCQLNRDREVLHPFDSVLSESNASAISGDLSIYTENSNQAILQVEGICVVSFSKATAENDCQLFHEVIWDVAVPSGELITSNNRASAEDYKLAILFERISYFYLRTLGETITQEELEASEWHHKSLMVYARHCISQVADRKQPSVEAYWKDDTRELIFELMGE